MNNVPGTKYILGHSPEEIQRLMSQAAMLRPITERLLRSAGIEPGMRVLDIGCGAGDVSMLAAELVGSTGSVVGIDRNEQVLAIAKERARLAKFGKIDFKEASIGTFSDPEPFDLVVGRYVLIHQTDPADLIRAAAALSRPGGIVAFHELNAASGLRSFPDVPLWQQLGNTLVTALKSAAPHWDAGARLTEHFSRAGLPLPRSFSEIPIGNAEDPHLIALAVNTLRSFMPQLIEIGAVTVEAVDIENLANRLTVAVTEASSQIEWCPQVCAWTKR
jgi:2-polyprenyl-3-methyl-5-hydroxy-6-metoxy-1,4-benzoquinol methylase